MIAVLDKVKHASTHLASLHLVPFCCLSLWPKENCFPLLYFSMFGVSGLVDFASMHFKSYFTFKFSAELKVPTHLSLFAEVYSKRNKHNYIHMYVDGSTKYWYH